MFSMFLDDFPNSLEGEDDKIITEENDEDIIKTEEVEQRHLEDMDDLNLDDLNRKKRSVETMDNTTTTTDAKDTHSFYKLLRFIQNEGVEGIIFTKEFSSINHDHILLEFKEKNGKELWFQNEVIFH